MDFIEYMNAWVKSEILQGRIMIVIGVVLVIPYIGIWRSENEFLRGSLFPLGLLLVVLIGYGGYIIHSRPAHAKKSIEHYKTSEKEALDKERIKHLNDNKAGKTLIRFVYPALMLISVIALFIVVAPYYKGMAIGFTLLFAATYVIDSGFVSRSDSFLSYLTTLT
jgi:hypothetical protein